jgi:hypothetical protein
MIKTGRYGQVAWDPTGLLTTALPVVISMNGWKLSLKTDYEDVSCFQDPNRVYVPGLKDVSGTLGGYWNSDSVVLFEAADATSPGMLELTPNTTEPTFLWKGLAYLDADIDASVKGAPKVSSTFKGAGPWTQEPTTP